MENSNRQNNGEKSHTRLRLTLMDHPLIRAPVQQIPGALKLRPDIRSQA